MRTTTGRTSRSSRFRWLAVLAVSALIVLGLTAFLASRQAPARRYVSPVLWDGARYTFLYPAGLEPFGDHVASRGGVPGSHRMIQYIWFNRRRGTFATLLYRSDLLRRSGILRWIFPQGDRWRVSSVTIHLDDVPTDRRQTGQTDRDWFNRIGIVTDPTDADPGVVVGTDAATGLNYGFAHQYAAPGSPPSSRRDDTWGTDGFRILAPGVATPAPQPTDVQANGRQRGPIF